MRITLVHDDFCQIGGAERLFAEIAKIYPNAPIYTSLVNWSKIPRSISPNRIHTSFIQKIPYAAKLYKILLPLYPLAFESFDFSGFDLVISSTTRFAKSIVTKPSTIHISYVNSAPRFLYNQDQANEYLPQSLRFILKPYFNWLKRWDKTASSRADFYVANSQNIAAQIKNVYGREAGIVHPAVDTDFFQNSRKSQKSGYYLVVSRLVKWKKIDIAIEACQQLGVNLKIVGKGPDTNRLKKLSGNSIEFIDNATREELRGLYQNAKALIVTQEEDFGMAMVEAQACGTSIIAYGFGGSKEIVVDGKTGLFFNKQTPQSAKDAINRHSKLKWGSTACRKSALRFSRATFRNNLTSAVSKYAIPNH
ncbi:MAG: glycosyltransferase [Patescibacteria group bacterium]